MYNCYWAYHLKLYRTGMHIHEKKKPNKGTKYLQRAILKL